MNCLTLKADNLSKTFGKGHTSVRAINNVSLKAAQGEIVLIMGPSGSGKTTLLTLLGLLLTPDKGEIIINKQLVSETPVKQLAKFRQKNIGFIFQSFHLISALNALENIQIVLELSGTRSKTAKQKAAKLLKNLGLSRRLKFFPKELSGGEKQRVSIARALANNPQLILADEPTANLDSQSGKQVMSMLRHIAKKQNRTVIIVSHDSRITNIADRVLWLEDGKLRHKSAGSPTRK